MPDKFTCSALPLRRNKGTFRRQNGASLPRGRVASSAMQEGPTSVEEELMEFLSIEEGFGVSTVPWGFGAHLIS